MDVRVIVSTHEDCREATEEKILRQDLYTHLASCVGFAAHTLNNYLTVSAVCADLLQRHLHDHPDAQIRTSLASLRHAMALMTHTVLRLKNASAIEGAHFIWEQVDLPTLVQWACNHYRQAAERKQIAISVEADVPCPFVWTDRVAVAAVFDNLLSNAVKFSPPQKRVWVQVTAEAAHLVCTVRDEGPGLTAAEQARLFQRGVRLSNVPTGGEPSTGYGLAVAKELAGKLNADLWCESQPGQGAAFAFRLPISRQRSVGELRSVDRGSIRGSAAFQGKGEALCDGSL